MLLIVGGTFSFHRCELSGKDGFWGWIGSRICVGFYKLPDMWMCARVFACIEEHSIYGRAHKSAELSAKKEAEEKRFQCRGISSGADKLSNFVSMAGNSRSLPSQ